MDEANMGVVLEVKGVVLELKSMIYVLLGIAPGNDDAEVYVLSNEAILILHIINARLEKVNARLKVLSMQLGEAEQDWAG